MWNYENNQSIIADIKTEIKQLSAQIEQSLIMPVNKVDASMKSLRQDMEEMKKMMTILCEDKINVRSRSSSITGNTDDRMTKRSIPADKATARSRASSVAEMLEFSDNETN